MKNSRLAIMIIATLLFTGVTQAANQQETQTGGWGTLSSGASWKRVEHGTTSDLSMASKLVHITRETYGINPASDWTFAASGGFCFDIHTGGPHIYLVEQGVLRWGFYDLDGTVSNLPTTGLALLSTAKDRGTPPVIVAPNTDLYLEPGDMVVGHHGASCGVNGSDPAVTFLRVEGLPTGPSRRGHPEYGIEVEALDPDIGLATARELAPPEVETGRLSLPIGESVTLDVSTMPTLFTIEQGAISVTTSADGGIILVNGSPSPLQPRVATTFNAGDSGYIPPGPSGIVTNAGDTDAVVFSVSIVPVLGEEEMPS